MKQTIDEPDKAALARVDVRMAELDLAFYEDRLKSAEAAFFAARDARNAAYGLRDTAKRKLAAILDAASNETGD